MIKSRFKNVFSVLLGTVVEYYDYGLYGFCPVILASHFLPKSSPASVLITTCGVFAIGYFAKPLGALIFGWIGDNFGRKASLNLTLLGIAVPTTLIGVLPTYNQIGFLASLGLILCRFAQGVFVAGQYDGAALYIIEHAQKHGKDFSSALIRFTGGLGLLLGSLSIMFFTSSYFPSWGWRIAFCLSLPLGLLSFYLRRSMVETPEFMQHLASAPSACTPFVNLLRKYWRNVLTIILLCGSFGSTFQICIIFLKTFLPIVLPAYTLKLNWATPSVILTFGLSMLLAGLLASKFGTARIICNGIVLAMFSVLGMIYSLLKGSIVGVLVSHHFLAVGIAPFNCLSHVLMYRLFSVNARYRCVSIGHTLGSMALSGTAPFFCSLFLKFNLTYAPLAYLFSLLLVGLGAVVICDRSRKNALLQAALEQADSLNKVDLSAVSV